MNLLITGLSGYLGQAVVARLMQGHPFRRVFGVDRVPPRMLGPVHFINCDVRHAEQLGDLMVTDGVDVVLHLAHTGARPGDTRSEAAVVRRLLELADIAGVRRVVIPSRDWVYAPSETPVAETAPLRVVNEGAGARLAALFGGELAAGKARVERVAIEMAAALPDVEVVIPRMATVLGPTRGRPIDGVLAQPTLLAPPRRDPVLNFLHIDDAARILLACAAKPGLRGAYNAAGAEPLHLSTVAGILQTRFLQPPAWVVSAGVQALSRIGVLPFAVRDVAQLHLGVPLDTTRLVEAIGPPVYTGRQTLAMWRVGHRVRVRDPVPARTPESSES
ncbi:MAG: NAD-dependent epimerase/dehydratase family protein [Myxococcales bacterium]|nr:NAD-dependent epimerase/dehydratase family protein [Myxococcales bacterium]